MMMYPRISISGRKVTTKLAENVDFGLDSILLSAICSLESQFY